MTSAVDSAAIAASLATQAAARYAFWAAVAAGASAVGTAATAAIAQTAATSWRTSLAQQRVDECVYAINDCEGSFGRALSLRMAGDAAAWQAVGTAWTDWRRCKCAYEVLATYKALPSTRAEGDRILERLNAFCSVAADADERGRLAADMAAFRDRFQRLARESPGRRASRPRRSG